MIHKLRLISHKSKCTILDRKYKRLRESVCAKAFVMLLCSPTRVESSWGEPWLQENVPTLIGPGLSHRRGFVSHLDAPSTFLTEPHRVRRRVHSNGLIHVGECDDDRINDQVRHCARRRIVERVEVIRSHIGAHGYVTISGPR